MSNFRHKLTEYGFTCTDTVCVAVTVCITLFRACPCVSSFLCEYIYFKATTVCSQSVTVLPVHFKVGLLVFDDWCCGITGCGCQK